MRVQRLALLHWTFYWFLFVWLSGLDERFSWLPFSVSALLWKMVYRCDVC